ncbi:hypothetical protein EP7_002927 [Isosphaeraceae bacterium EP7]
MDIDYEGLYAHDYFGHDAGATSFRACFHERLAALAAELGCAGLVDVGSGNGELVRRVRPLGLRGLALDLRGDDEAGVLPFNLIGADPAPAHALLPEIASRLELGDAQHLTSCLDVLEHIGRPGMAAALANLADLAGRWMLVSVSTRPSSRDNLYHATVIPPRTWRRLFDAAGFEVVPHDGVAEIAGHQDYPDTESCRALNLWRKIDPFGDSHGTEPFYMLLRRKADAPSGPVDRAALASAFASILLIPPAVESPVAPGTHLCFLIGHYQDFHHYRPYWDALDRGSVTVLVRSGALRGIEDLRHRAMLAYLKSRGLRVVEVSSVRDVDWAEMPGTRRALIVATESTANDGHMLNAAFVLAAKGSGFRTFQLQHGIWPHTDFDTPVAFACDHVLSWSADCRESFLRETRAPDGSAVTEALVGPTRFLETGCAKFDAYGDDAISAADLLGDWAGAYRRTVLVATNLHWPRHAAGAAFLPALVEAASARPDVLFLCKLHPVHDVDATMLEGLPANVKVLDEFACLFGGLDTPALVRASDAVVGTLSTVALEAALAGKPFAVFDTANPNAYVGVEPVPLAGFGAEVDRLLDPANREAALDRHARFRDHYYRPDLLGVGLARTLGAIDDALNEAPAPSPWSDHGFVLARRLSEQFADHYTPGGRHQFDFLSGHVTAQDARIKGLDDQVEFLNGHITLLNGHVAAQDARLKGLDDETVFLNGHITLLNGHVAAQDAKVKGLDDQVGFLNGHIAFLDGHVAAQAGKIITLEDQSRELTRHYEAATAHATALSGRLDASQAYSAALEGHLRRTEAALSAEHEGRLATASSLQDTVAELAAARARVVAAEARGDRLLERLNEARSGLIHARVRLDSAHSRLDDTRARLHATQERLAPVADLGPLTIGLARRIRHFSVRYPRLSTWTKKSLTKARKIQRKLRP